MSRKALWIVLGAFLAAGCLKAGGKGGASEAIATVNGNPITEKDLRRELAIRAKKDPSFRITPATIREQVDVLVTRRLLIQEAQRRRLTEDDRFTQTIQTFWEQTLVRLLMDRLYDEFDRTVVITEEEVAKYYERLAQKATFRILPGRDTETLTEAARRLQEGGEVAWERTVGPVRWDEIRSEALAEAFDLTPGQSRVYREGDGYALVQLVSKEADTPPSLDSIRGKIRERIKERKQEREFEEWLNRSRRDADVKLSLDRWKDAS